MAYLMADMEGIITALSMLSCCLTCWTIAAGEVVVALAQSLTASTACTISTKGCGTITISILAPEIMTVISGSLVSVDVTSEC